LDAVRAFAVALAAALMNRLKVLELDAEPV
jgi:hypothetical protein